MRTQQISQTSAPVTITATEKDAIKILHGYALERRTALLINPRAYGLGEKLQAIDEIISMLVDAENMYPKAACKHALKTRLNFAFIAPNATKVIFIKWHAKVSVILDACAAMINYKPQTN